MRRIVFVREPSMINSFGNIELLTSFSRTTYGHLESNNKAGSSFKTHSSYFYHSVEAELVNAELDTLASRFGTL